MKKICYITSFWKSLIVFVLLTVFQASAASREKARVESIQPKIKNDSLLANFEITDLFSPKISGVLHSGLPVRIEIDIRLFEIGGGVVLQKKLRAAITYNIWQEQYSFRFENRTERFRNFEKLKKRAGLFRRIFLIPASRISKNKQYLLRAKANIERASDRQNKKLRYWLNGAQKRDEVTSQERRSSFSLNLNQLISFFITRDESGDKNAVWKERRFRLAELKKIDPLH